MNYWGLFFSFTIPGIILGMAGMYALVYESETRRRRKKAAERRRAHRC